MRLTYLVRVGAIAVALADIVLLVRRWRRACPLQRHAVMPVVGGGGALAILDRVVRAAELSAVRGGAVHLVEVVPPGQEPRWTTGIRPASGHVFRSKGDSRD